MSWRVARSLEVLREQVNLAYPGRSKASDGTKASSEHSAQNPNSDHEPDANGVVRALDITHDPAHGLDSEKLAEALRQSRDPRIQYIISNRKIANQDIKDWAWRPYTRDNPHDKHCHISVVKDPRLYDDTTPFRFDDDKEAEPSTPNSQRFVGITATVWGGPDDHLSSGKGAYGILNHLKPQVALPYNFKSHKEPLPKVRLFYDEKSVVCDVSDVGPWNTNDPYWKGNGRPQAESGTDLSGRKTNGAGIDITVAAADALGLPGTGVQRKSKIDWEFVTAPQPSEPAPIKPEPPSPITPPVDVSVPPHSPQVDWELISRLYSTDWKLVLARLSDGVSKVEEARQELEKRVTQQDIFEKIQRSGGTAAQYAEDRNKKGTSIMNSDNLWQIVRYILIGGGAFLAGKGYVTEEQVSTLVDKLPTIASGLASVFGVLWGLYVKMGTKAVPAATAARVDVPTVSAATGVVKHG